LASFCVFRTVQDTIHDIRFALRSFKRTPLAALTIVATLATGLGIVAVLFTILNTFLFRVDAVPDVDELYAVERPQGVTSDAPLFTRPVFESFRRETSVFRDVYAAMSDIDVRVDGLMMSATLVTGNFLDVVRVSPQMGRPLGPKDDEPGANRVVVLSDRGWTRHFDRDPNVVGRAVLIGGVPFEIVGVMPAGFRGLQVKAPDFWAPLAQVGIFRPARRGSGGSVPVEVIGRLPQDMGVEAARTRIAAWTNQPARIGERRAEMIELRPRRGTIPRPMEAVAVFTPLFFVFGLVLMIGCANVANLLLARGVARQREIGIRLSLGASRPRIVRQFLTESGLLALGAAAAGYVLSRLALTSLQYFLGRAMPVDLGDVNIEMVTPAGDWRVAVFLVVAAGVATAFFALLPALHVTRTQPARTIRGELVSRGRPGRARNALIGLQVFASALLLISAAVFLRSAIASSRFDPGFRTSDTVIIEMPNESTRVAMVGGIASAPTISAYAAVRPNTLQGSYGGVATTIASQTPVTYKLVSPEYFDVLDIPIVRGRSFNAAERDGEEPVAVVPESFARTLWPNRSGIGETFRLERSPDSSWRSDATTAGRLVTVVGVSRDVPGFRMMDANEGGIFLPTSASAPSTSIVARVVGDPDMARRTLLERLTRIDPNMGLIVTMRTVARLETFFLNIAFWVSLVLGGIAILLTVSGLFSVLSYLVEQRTREIGVRIALGASSRNVTRFVLAQTTRPVAYGLLAGAGLAASLATVLVASPAAGPITQMVRVTDPVAYLTSLLSIVAACLFAAWIPAARAARLDPKQTLKHE
jgi:predicted permease